MYDSEVVYIHRKGRTFLDTGRGSRSRETQCDKAADDLV